MSEADLALRDMANVPDYIRESEEKGQGLDSIRAKDIVVPRLVLMQALSPEVTKGLFKAGDLVHNITEDLIAPAGEPLRFVPIKHFVQWIEWKPRSAGGGMVAQSTDPHSDLAKRCESGEVHTLPGKPEDGKPTITEYHNFIVYARSVGQGMGGVLMIPCAKTNYKCGKQLCSRIKMRGPDSNIFDVAYTVHSKDETNKNNQVYKIFKFDQAGWATEEEFKFCAASIKAFQDKTISANLDDEMDPAAASAAAESEM